MLQSIPNMNTANINDEAFVNINFKGISSLKCEVMI